MEFGHWARALCCSWWAGACLSIVLRLHWPHTALLADMAGSNWVARRGSQGSEEPRVHRKAARAKGKDLRVQSRVEN